MNRTRFARLSRRGFLAAGGGLAAVLSARSLTPAQDATPEAPAGTSAVASPVAGPGLVQGGAVATTPVGAAQGGDPLEGLRVVAFGDSLMWGQGLRRADTFASLFTAGLNRPERPATLVMNRARSGAVLLASREVRTEFVETFPEVFSSPQERQRFEDGDESHAWFLHGEVPAKFPTIFYQVASLADGGPSVDVVLLTGGVNDVDFEEVIDPRVAPGEFIEKWNEEIRSITHDGLLDQIRWTREVCPNAIILVFGYFAPLSYGSEDQDIEDFFKYEFDNNALWNLNQIFEIEDIDHMIREAKVRSMWAQGRAQHWMRKAVTDANQSAAIRGPGIVFVSSGLGPERSAFGEQSEVFQDYRPPTEDDAREVRLDQCPRMGVQDPLKAFAFKLALGSASQEEIQSARAALTGPEPLLDALDRLLADPDDDAARTEALWRIGEEGERLHTAEIASFLHPGPALANRYAENGLARYAEQLDLAAIVAESEQIGASEEGVAAGPETLSQKLARYGLRGQGTLLADIGHLNVDAISLIVETEPDSDVNLAPDMFLRVAAAG
jgi:lysophospholipase L1-like esterase